MVFSPWVPMVFSRWVPRRFPIYMSSEKYQEIIKTSSRDVTEMMVYEENPPDMAELVQLGERLQPIQYIYTYIYIYIWRVVWNFSLFPYIGNNNPNRLIFFGGVGIPPTRYILWDSH